MASDELEDVMCTAKIPCRRRQDGLAVDDNACRMADRHPDILFTDEIDWHQFWLHRWGGRGGRGGSRGRRDDRGKSRGRRRKSSAHREDPLRKETIDDPVDLRGRDEGALVWLDR